MLMDLRFKRLGCFLKNVYIGAVMYADDLLLLTASVNELQRMLDVCGEIGAEIGITFNSTKSHCMMVGPNKLPIPTPMVLNNSEIYWCSKFKYLASHLQSHLQWVTT